MCSRAGDNVIEMVLAFVVGCLVGGWTTVRVLKLGFYSMVRKGRLQEMLREYDAVTGRR